MYWEELSFVSWLISIEHVRRKEILMKSVSILSALIDLI